MNPKTCTEINANITNRWSLKGKKALVTGATKGIGLGISEELLMLGAEICIVARSEQEINKLLQQWETKEHICYGIAADLSTPDGRKAILEKIEALWGKDLDILINNVGTNIRKPTNELTSSEIEKIFQTNFFSTFELCRLLFPHLAKSGQASVVNIGSIAGSRILTTGSIYAVTKAAVDHLSRYLAVEWAHSGIRVNSVVPGYIETPLTETALANPEFKKRVEKQTPLGRIGLPQDVAAMAAFLCLPAASYITGTVTPVDGGFSAFSFEFLARSN